MEELVYPLKKDADWISWGGNFATVLLAQAASLGVNLLVAQDVQTTFNAFSTAWEAATAPNTRSKPTITTKDTRLTAFKNLIKPVIGQIQANTSVTNTQRVQLGLRVRDVTPSPVPVPTITPVLAVLLTGPQSIRVSTNDPNDQNRRAKPAGVKQIAVHTFLAAGGETPPSDVMLWPLAKLSGRKTIDLYWPGMAGETTVHVACYYVNSRNQNGPISAPTSVRLPGNGVAEAA